MASLREVGQRLRQAREGQGLSLEDIAARTRITVRHLLALEEGNETDLPEVFYIRGFLKKYAEAVGLAPNEVADAYRAAPIPTATTPDIRPGVGPIAYYLVIAGLLGGALALAWHFQPRVSVVDDPTATATPAAQPSPAAVSPSPLLAVATASPSATLAPSPSATATAMALMSPAASPSPSASAAASPAARPTDEARPSPTTRPSPSVKPSPTPRPSPTTRPSPSVKPSPTTRPSPSVRPSPKPSPTAKAAPTVRPTQAPGPSPAGSPSAVTSPAAATPTPSPTARPTAKPTPAPPKQVTVRLDFVERSWVEVVVDGRLVFEGVLSRGSERQFKGKKVEVSAGNSGGVRITANGRDLGRMGQHGVVVTRTYRP